MYLHQNLVIHRDLKLGNLFIDNQMNIKIGDFGLACQLKDKNERRKSVCGTPNYLAPEMLETKKWEGHNFGVDVWGFGIVIYVLLVGQAPFQDEDIKEQYRKIRENDLVFPADSNVSQDAQDFLRYTLVTDPNARPTIRQVREHPFLQSTDDCIIPETLPRDFLNSQPS